jgi:YfiH family protein
VGDDEKKVVANRILVGKQAPKPIIWLNQTHSNKVYSTSKYSQTDFQYDADASFSLGGEFSLAILTADCIPVVLYDGSSIAIVHSGWRGLINGVLENTIAKFNTKEIFAFIGVCIGAKHYEVQKDMYDEVVHKYSFLERCFEKKDNTIYNFSLSKAINKVLLHNGVKNIFLSEMCSFCDDRFFSYRKKNKTGRTATIVWQNK